MTRNKKDCTFRAILQHSAALSKRFFVLVLYRGHCVQTHRPCFSLPIQAFSFEVFVCDFLNCSTLVYTAFNTLFLSLLYTPGHVQTRQHNNQLLK